MSVYPTDSADAASLDKVHNYSEVSSKDDGVVKIGDKELLAMLKKLHELMQKEVDEKEKATKKEKEEKEGNTILIANDFKYWWSPHTWPKRVYYSSFMNLLCGNNVNIDEIDEVINTLALINALIVTIPFGMIMDIGPDFWGNMKDMVVHCNEINANIDFDYDSIFVDFRNDIVTIIYGATMALILIVIYYLLRPRGDEELFRRWWTTAGNRMFPALCVLTICSIVALLTLSSHLLKFNFINPDSFCNMPNVASYRIGYIAISLMVFFAIWIML